MLEMTSREYRYALSSAKDAAERHALARKVATGEITLTDAEPARLAPASLEEAHRLASSNQAKQEEVYVNDFSFSLGDRADFMRKVQKMSPDKRAGTIRQFDELVAKHNQ